MIPILDLTPKSKYADGNPIYKFHTPFGSNRVWTLESKFATPEEAYNHGKQYAAEYERRYYPGGMAGVLGVTKVEDGYKAVYTTYYSNT
jgi:hypothetical protein